MTSDDRDLRRAFAELREPDRRGSPSFASVLEARRGPSLRGGGFAIALALATVVAVAIAVAKRREVAPTAGSITDWRAPTDVLLRTPGDDVIHSVPTLRSSLLDGVAVGVGFTLQ